MQPFQVFDKLYSLPMGHCAVCGNLQLAFSTAHCWKQQHQPHVDLPWRWQLRVLAFTQFSHVSTPSYSNPDFLSNFSPCRWATFIGLFVLLLSTPISGKLVAKLTQYRREMLKHTDQRVKLMNQLLVGIRVLKMYAWEAAQEAAVRHGARL